MKKGILILTILITFNISFGYSNTKNYNNTKISKEKLVKEFEKSKKSDILYENFRKKFKNDEEFMDFINQNELYDYIEKRDDNAK